MASLPLVVNEKPGLAMGMSGASSDASRATGSCEKPASRPTKSSCSICSAMTGDRCTSVADLADAEADTGVERAMAVVVVQVGALGSDDHPRVGTGKGAIKGCEITCKMANLGLDQSRRTRG